MRGVFKSQFSELQKKRKNSKTSLNPRETYADDCKLTTAYVRVHTIADIYLFSEIGETVHTIADNYLFSKIGETK